MEKYTYFYVNTPSGKKKMKMKLDNKEEELKGMEEVRGGYITETQPSVMRIERMEVLGEKDEDLRQIESLKIDGIEIPKIITEKQADMLSQEDMKMTNIKYPLIPQDPKQGEKIYAYANIFFDSSLNELVYYVFEPPISEDQKKILENIKEYIQEKLEVNFAQIRKAEAVGYITEIFSRAVSYFKVKMNVDVLRYYVIRDFIGLEAIEPLIQDKNIEDISCDGANIPIYVYHRDPRLGSLRTNIIFSKKDELDSFANKLSERCGKTISVARPLLDGSLPDGSRIQATLGSDIARHGSNFTIRMFTEKPLTPVDMIKFGTMDLKTMAYLWFLIEHEASILVSGGTASGKTSILNVLSLFIKPQLKIVSIEDTAELRLPHAHWVPEVARTPIAEEGSVDMFELLRESLRQRPDYIIVGEVRGKEAYVLFQQMATGHAGLSTIHADTFPKLLDRLTTEPISLPPNLIQNLDLVLFVRRVKQGRKYSRRISSLTEILGFNHKSNMPMVNEIIKWNAAKDEFPILAKSAVLKKIANNTGMTDEDVKNELLNRAKILEWMLRQNISDYKNVSQIINLYYLSPDFLMNKIEGGL